MAEPGQPDLPRSPSPVFHTARDAGAEEMQAFVGSLRPFWGRALLYIVLLFVGIALIWAWWGKVDVVASAPFRLVPLGKVKTLQARRGGEIQHIGVSEGDRIDEGQLLFKLKSWETWGDLRELEQAEMAFRKAEYDFKRVLPRRKELNRETIASLEKRLAVLQRFMAAHQSALKDYHADEGDGGGAGNDAAEAELRAQIGFRQAEIDHLKQDYLQQKMLFERQLISKVDINDARVRYLSALAALPGRMSEIYKQETAVQDLKRRILETRIAHGRETSQMKHAFETARLRLEQARKRVDRQLEAESDLILAPESGIVTRVEVNTLGQVINKGQALVSLAPASAPIVAELTVLNRDVGLLKPGQIVKLKYDAFAFQDFGIKRGWLRQISPDAVIDETVGPIFRGIVELEETTMVVKGREKPLLFGMKGTAEIMTDRQSVLLMLLSPLRKLYESATYDATSTSAPPQGEL
ncbi:MAG: HlyD family efflux transporter periplasmic adaptor subunit [Candidatus Latescibacteria bacterium]|nr:HlyD family efflux transporter periplasmic adaptor subunit [Candidatus Latescibacterota bacterium]